MKYLALLVLLCYLVVLTNGLCQTPVLEQRREHTWQEADGRRYALWYVRIRNPIGGDPLSKVYLDIHPRSPGPSQLWGLELKSARRYIVPDYVTENPVPAGNFHEFGYIVQSHDYTYSPISFILFDHACPAREDCMCTLQYAPICGEDNNTYGNECQAKCAGILKEKEGEC